jgi:hypothetical protein
VSFLVYLQEIIDLYNHRDRNTQLQASLRIFHSAGMIKTLQMALPYERPDSWILSKGRTCPSVSTQQIPADSSGQEGWEGDREQ